MYKLMTFVRRKPGTTHQEFKNYYESIHSKLGEEYLPAGCVKYLRRYLTPIRDPDWKTNQPPHPEFDCVVEFWFESEAAFKAFEPSVADPATGMIADEERFMDRANTFLWMVEDHLSWGAPEPGRARHD